MKVGLPEQLPAPEGAKLTVWVIYDHPLDFPKGYVLRPQYVMPGSVVTPSPTCWYADDPDKLRAIIPFGMSRMHRHPDDDPAVLETWM